METLSGPLKRSPGEVFLHLEPMLPYRCDSQRTEEHVPVVNVVSVKDLFACWPSCGGGGVVAKGW